MKKNSHFPHLGLGPGGVVVVFAVTVWDLTCMCAALEHEDAIVVDGLATTALRRRPTCQRRRRRCELREVAGA